MNIKKRSSNFELLRIIAMYLIVCHHYVLHGTFNIFKDNSSNSTILSVFAIGGKVGIDIFVMIGAYFLSEKEFKLSRLKNLVFETFFYSYFFFLLFGNKGVSSSTGIIGVLLPIPFDYWFVTTYFMILLLFPFINVLIKTLSRRRLGILISILLISISVVSLIPIKQVSAVLPELGATQLGSFIMLYLIGGYIRKYCTDYKYKNYGIFLTVIGIIISCSLVLFVCAVASKYPNLGAYKLFLVDYYKLPIVVTATGIVLWVRFIKLGNNSVINTLSSTTFGIYLIHDNEYVRKIIWPLINNIQYNSLITSLIATILIPLVIFIVCSLIDIIRQLIFKYIRYFSGIRE